MTYNTLNFYGNKFHVFMAQKRKFVGQHCRYRTDKAKINSRLFKPLGCFSLTFKVVFFLFFFWGGGGGGGGYGLTTQSTAMVISRCSVNQATLFLGKLRLSSKPVLCAHTLAYNWQPFMYQQKKGYDRRKYFTINLHKSMGPVWDQTYDPWISNWTI